jgi:hypothetical protein
MITTYIHTHQLLEAKKNIDVNLYPLRTFVGWALFGKKDHISPGIGTMEFKARILSRHYGMAPEDIVEKVSRQLIISLMLYEEGAKTLKSFLLTCINYSLDKTMGMMGRKEALYMPKPIRAYREREVNTGLRPNAQPSKKYDDEIETFGGIETSKPAMPKSPTPAVVLRKKKAVPAERTFLDLYDDEL